MTLETVSFIPEDIPTMITGNSNFQDHHEIVNVSFRLKLTTIFLETFIIKFFFLSKTKRKGK